LAKSPLDSISIEDLDNFLNKIKIKDVDVVADRSQPLFPVSGVNVPTERMPSSDGGFDTASDFYRAGEALRNEMREQPWSLDTAFGKIFSEVLPYYGGAVGGVADVAGAILQPTPQELERQGIAEAGIRSIANIIPQPPMSRQTLERKLARDLFALADVGMPELAGGIGSISQAPKVISKVKAEPTVDIPSAETLAKPVEPDLPVPQVINATEDAIVIEPKSIDQTKPIQIGDDGVKVLDINDVDFDKIEIPKIELTDKELVGNFYNAGVDMLLEAGIRRNPKVTLASQIKDVMDNDLISSEKLIEIGNKYEITPLEVYNQAYGVGTSEAAKIMQVAAATSRRLEKLGVDIPENLPTPKLSSKIFNSLKDLESSAKGMLVSPIVTLMRNISAQAIRIVPETMDRVFDNILAKVFTEEPVDFSKTFELFTNLTFNAKETKDITKLLEATFPEVKKGLNVSYSADVAKRLSESGGTVSDKFFGGLRKGVDFLNTFNGWADSVYRRSMFVSSFAERLRKKGVDIKDVLKTDNIYKYRDEASKAVEDALYFTYSSDIPENAGLVTDVYKGYTDLVGKIPFASFVVSTPFPRFLYNSLNYFYNHSPLGFLSFMGKGGFKALSKGDKEARKQLSQAMTGSLMFATAYQAASSDMIGEKWFEFRLGKDDKGDDVTLDIRPYSPVSYYFWAAKLIKDYVDGLPVTKEYINEMFEGLTGIRNIPGTGFGNGLLDVIADATQGIDSTEKFSRFVTSTLKIVIDPFLRPIKELDDFITQDQRQRTTVPTGDVLTDIWQEIKKNIPILRSELPEAYSPTRSETPGKLTNIPFTNIEAGPALRQITGATFIEPKSNIEKELDRMRIPRRQILPSSGVKEFDLQVARELGPIIEATGNKVLSSPAYKNASNSGKRKILVDEYIAPLRRLARTRAKFKNPDTFLKVMYKSKSKIDRALIEENPVYVERLKKLGIIKD
jgi:hypothetical protein